MYSLGGVLQRIKIENVLLCLDEDMTQREARDLLHVPGGKGPDVTYLRLCQDRREEEIPEEPKEEEKEAPKEEEKKDDAMDADNEV